LPRSGPRSTKKMLGHCNQKNVNFDNFWKGVPNPPAQMYLKTSQPSLHILLNVISIIGSYNRITLIFFIFLGAIQLSLCHCIATVMAENIAQSPHMHLIHFYHSINFDSQSGPIRARLWSLKFSPPDRGLIGAQSGSLKFGNPNLGPIGISISASDFQEKNGISLNWNSWNLGIPDILQSIPVLVLFLKQKCSFLLQFSYSYTLAWKGCRQGKS
jgi:hypothetical protein